MATTMQTNGQVLYSVEQIELIRRLRNSGITKEQLVQAFDAFDRIDRELGPVYNIPVTISQAISQHLFAQQALNAVAAAQTALNSQQQQTIANAPGGNSAAAIKAQLEAIANAHQQAQQATQTINARKRAHDNGTPSVNGENGETSEDSMSSNIVPNGSSIDPAQLLKEEIPDDHPELLMFISHGEPATCEEIRNFVAMHNIRQQQIATLSGISQSYVSRFLKGDYFDMSERSRRAIQKWYIAYRSKPDKIAPMVNQILMTQTHNNSVQPPFKKINTISAELNQLGPHPGDAVLSNSPNDLQFTPKRERFVFRPSHLEILEQSFAEDSYPSIEKREEIARLCNAATGVLLQGRPLSERECVTAQIISNWFANKRKEMKKIAREEGLDVSQVPLRPRGRPARVYSEILNLSRNGSMNDYPQVGQGEGSPSESNSEDIPTDMSHHNGCNEFNGSPDLHDEKALSLSVELAAVNQAILSLTGQEPLLPKNFKMHMGLETRPENKAGSPKATEAETMKADNASPPSESANTSPV